MEQLKSEIRHNYEAILSEIEPNGGLVKAMMEKGTLDAATYEVIKKRTSRYERAKTLVDFVLKSQHPITCLEFLKAMEIDYEWISKQITLRAGKFILKEK